MFCEPSHTQAARNSQPYIRNDPRDDINDSNDATDPVDDDSVTNYTRWIIFSRDKKLENNREARVDPTCLSRDLCLCVCVLPSRLCFEMSNHLLLASFHKHLSRPCLHSALDIILCSGKFQRVFTNLKYPDKSRMSLADCGPVCLCCDARLPATHNSVSLTDNLF